MHKIFLLIPKQSMHSTKCERNKTTRKGLSAKQQKGHEQTFITEL